MPRTDVFFVLLLLYIVSVSSKKIVYNHKIIIHYYAAKQCIYNYVSVELYKPKLEPQLSEALSEWHTGKSEDVTAKYFPPFSRQQGACRSRAYRLNPPKIISIKAIPVSDPRLGINSNMKYNA